MARIRSGWYQNLASWDETLPATTTFGTGDLRASLAEHGFVHLRGLSQADLVDVLEALGRTIYVEEVRDTPGGVSLVKSRSGIDWHTDHHRAERIVWYCLSSAEEGGETLVADGLAALGLLHGRHVEALRNVMLTDHSVFRGDPPRHAMLTGPSVPAGSPRLYFSLWLTEETTGAERAAFEAFGEALEKVEHHRFLLEPGDVLAIDNTRMAHARTAIGGQRVRHLRRYWLAAT